MTIKLDRRRPTETQKTIEEKLRNHPKGGKEILKIANLMPGKTPTERTAQAQLYAIAFVEEIYHGDVTSFLKDYAGDTINYASIIQYAGRVTLGLSPLDKEGKKIYG